MDPPGEFTPLYTCLGGLELYSKVHHGYVQMPGDYPGSIVCDTYEIRYD